MFTNAHGLGLMETIPSKCLCLRPDRINMDLCHRFHLMLLLPNPSHHLEDTRMPHLLHLDRLLHLFNQISMDNNISRVNIACRSLLQGHLTVRNPRSMAHRTHHLYRLHRTSNKECPRCIRNMDSRQYRNTSSLLMSVDGWKKIDDLNFYLETNIADDYDGI